MPFNEQEQAIITFGTQNGKSVQEIKDAVFRFRTTGSPKAPNQPTPPLYTAKEAGTDVAETVKGVGSQLMRAGENIYGTLESDLSGVEKAVQAGSQTFRGVSRTLGEGVLGIGKLLLPQKAEEAVSSRFQSFASTIMGSENAQKIKNWYDSRTPEEKRYIQNIAGYAEGLGDLAGVGVSKKPLSFAGKTFKSKADDITRAANQLTFPKVTVKPPTLKPGTFLSDLADDIIPSTEQARDGMIAKAFRLAPVDDIARIKKLTGNSIGDFLARNDLIKNTVKETAHSVDDFFKQNYNAVRDLVAITDEKVAIPYNLSDLPEANVVIDDLVREFSKAETPTYQAVIERLNAIKQSGTVDLIQLQEIKSLYDQVKSIYTRSGEVRAAMSAKAADDAISSIRRFIENEVQSATGANVRMLNNNVQTAREFADAVARRAGKADTASMISLTDLSTLGFGTLVDPIAGVGALGVKKVLEAPTMRLRLAQWLSGKADDFKGATRAELDKIEELVRKELGEIIFDPSNRHFDSAIQATPKINSKAATPIKNTLPRK